LKTANKFENNNSRKRAGIINRDEDDGMLSGRQLRGNAPRFEDGGRDPVVGGESFGESRRSRLRVRTSARRVYEYTGYGNFAVSADGEEEV
jgi:hypothetical protein